MIKKWEIMHSGPWEHEIALAAEQHPPPRRLFPLTIIVALLLIAALLEIPRYIQKWLWMRELDYVNIFWTILSVQWRMFCVSFAVAFLYLWINLRHAASNDAFHRRVTEGSAAERDRPWTIDMRLALRWLRPAIFMLSAVVALVFATVLYAQWDIYLRFRYGGAFGLTDPLFGVDIGFYIFHLPFYNLLQGWLTYLTVITLAAVIGLYMLLGLLKFGRAQRTEVRTTTTSHLTALMFTVVAVLGWGFYLDHYNLVYSTLGVVYGAGYTADHVTRVALWTMGGASIIGCALLAFNFFLPRVKTLTVGLGIYTALYVIGIVLLPFSFQKLVVQPSELALETPYLNKYIASTRKAYQLDTIQETSYPALTDLTRAAIARNQDTVQNIRLWDARPLLQTYHQTQAIRLYYQFYNVDTDRYHLRDGYHQVMLSTRELSPDLPAKAQTWVNQYLQFTHGYGMVMNFVSKTVGDGVPQYLLDDIPAKSDYGLTINQPAIYYGESMPGYRIVATGIKEFDYPKGNNNVYTGYRGRGGIPLDSLWKRFLFAWTQGDVNILLTAYLRPESRIQIWRRVQERVAQIAPFLRLDKDPYAVLSDGKLYWIQDAYTVSNYYPYANPIQAMQDTTRLGPSSSLQTMGKAIGADAGGTEARGPATFEDGLNYIRNSVKVVVDMYDGTVRFYVMDAKDPVLAVYRTAFPGVFKDLGELSADLKRHLRYPEDLFTVQADQYRTFHMRDPQVFYNREDLWEFPVERYAGEVQSMRPYYILMKLPGTDELQYLLMTPFTPHSRDNMISWLAAKSDFPEYGKMLFYELPKEKLIYGPRQVEAMIDQNTTISQQLTLWDQRGSRVIRGKQIVTPLDNSFLYVVPLYLTAAGTNFPQLKRVIAVAGDNVVMAPTLDEVLNDLFAAPKPKVGMTQPGAQTIGAGKIPIPALEQARRELESAKKAMQQGDWENFGRAMEALQHSLTGAPE
jgi:hypothetical protein